MVGHPAPEERRGARPLAFLVAVFVAGGAITAVVAYLGVVGALGGGIIGTEHHTPPPPPPLTSCLGGDRLGSFHFTFVAGLKGTYTFNGSSPGPCVAVAAGSQVTVTFRVDVAAAGPDSWAVIPSTGPADAAPVYPGAGWTNATATSGIGPGASANFSFTASAPGEYRYVSQVDGHAAAGMFGGFNVTAAPAAALPIASTGAAGLGSPASDGGMRMIPPTGAMRS